MCIDIDTDLYYNLLSSERIVHGFFNSYPSKKGKYNNLYPSNRGQKIDSM